MSSQSDSPAFKPGQCGGIAEVRDQSAISVGCAGDTDLSNHMCTLHWDGKRWSRGTVPQDGDGGLISAAAIPGGGLWAVGATDGHHRALVTAG